MSVSNVKLSELKKLKVTELRDELARRGLETKGVKDDLIVRLSEAMEAEATVEAEGQGAEMADAEQINEVVDINQADNVIDRTAPVGTDMAGDDSTLETTVNEKPEPGKTAKPKSFPTQVNTETNKPSSALTEDEKKKLRAERFGTTPTQSNGKGQTIGGLGQFDAAEELERRKKRAERFGLPVPVSAAEEEARKKQRAERFGLQVPISKEELKAKLEARAARFGLPISSQTTASSKGESDAEARKREERAKRFAQS